MHEFIQLLPHGYDTHLGEQAARLSISARLSDALARLPQECACLNPDEPTAHLTLAHAALLRSGGQCLAQGLDCAGDCSPSSDHRPADHLVLLDHGRVVETGSPAELLNRDGSFRSLFASPPDVLAEQAELTEFSASPILKPSLSLQMGCLTSRFLLTSFSLCPPDQPAKALLGRAALSILLGLRPRPVLSGCWLLLLT
jgi:hypothetical protein